MPGKLKLFEKYKLDELYIGSVNVIYSICPERIDDDIGGFLSVGVAGYGYLTVLRKVGEDQFIDLQNPKVEITKTVDPRTTSYTISYVEPLSNYYTPDGKKKETFSRRQAIKEAEHHYVEAHQKRRYWPKG